MALVDTYQKKIDYLRISITDNCNLKCKYCSLAFCGSCNRLRLTADGKIKSCLFSNDEMNIKAPLRRGASKKELIEFFMATVKHKPRRHQLNGNRQGETGRGMYAIGG